MAALLFAGPGGRLTGLSSAAVRGWRFAMPGEPVYTVIPEPRRVQSRSFVQIARTRLPGAQSRCGFALTEGEHTLAACARQLSARELTALTATALQRREVSLSGISLFIDRHPYVPGVRSLARSVSSLVGGAESIREVDSLAIFRAFGLPLPICQVEIYEDGRLVAIADFWWDGVAVFFDGATHLTKQSQDKDRAQRTRLEAMDIQVVVFTSESHQDRKLMRRRLESAFAAAARRSRPDTWTIRPR